MTVPVVARESRPCKDHNVVIMKRVEGQLLRREESYTEADALVLVEEEHDGDDADREEVVYSLKQTEPPSRHSRMALAPVENVNCYAPSVSSSPALRRNVRAWCDATGLPTTITVRCKDRVFHLHKVLCTSRGCMCFHIGLCGTHGFRLIEEFVVNGL